MFFFFRLLGGKGAVPVVWVDENAIAWTDENLIEWSDR